MEKGLCCGKSNVISNAEYLPGPVVRSVVAMVLVRIIFFYFLKQEIWGSNIPQSSWASGPKGSVFRTLD